MTKMQIAKVKLVESCLEVIQELLAADNRNPEQVLDARDYAIRALAVIEGMEA